MTLFQEWIEQTMQRCKVMAEDDQLAMAVKQVGDKIIDVLSSGHIVYTCGNGGSMAEAMHLSGELVGRFEIGDRAPLPSITLGANPVIASAIVNDYNGNIALNRESECISSDDMLIAYTTSGDSTNIVNAAKIAKIKGTHVVAITGAHGGEIAHVCDILIKVPAGKTALVQHLHMIVTHALCSQVDQAFAGKKVPI